MNRFINNRGTWSQAAEAKQRCADRAQRQAKRWPEGDYRRSYYEQQARDEQACSDEYAAYARSAATSAIA